MLNESNAPVYRWFEDSELNASYNCIDRHFLKGRGAATAIIFEADDGTVSYVKYEDYLYPVCRQANALKSAGVNKGDRVVIYLPMPVEGIVAMQACAGIGATHSLFSVASPRSLSMTDSWTSERWRSSPPTNRCAAAKHCPLSRSPTKPWR